jgi:hypothetical protein
MVRVHGDALKEDPNDPNRPSLKAQEDPDYVHHLVSGHVLMATCPPASHIANTPDVPYLYQMPDVEPASLTKLLAICSDLAIPDGEITPVMAWSLILRSGILPEIGTEGVKSITEELAGKVRCYGYVLPVSYLVFGTIWASWRRK